MSKLNEQYCMRNLRFLLMAAFFICTATPMFAQTKPTDDVKSIDAYCKTIDVLTARRKASLIFADTSDYTDAKAKQEWQKFATEKALEKFRETTETYNIAYNWQKNGRIAAANFTSFSASGDWAMYIFHCFRDDGSLARAKLELRTFYGDYIVTQLRYFDRGGKVLRKSIKYQDLTTRKPKKPPSDYNSNFSEADVFMKTSKLPFAHLLNKK
ncbi:MAG: hypothetical protein ABIO36_09240 [Pyrinomonadaceae bacterium]